MSYSEKDGQVILTMSHDDHGALLIRMGIAAGYFAKLRKDASQQKF